MSFRNRLTLFFVAIVIVPMVSVAFVLFSLISDNEKGKADAALRARQQTAVNLYTAARQAADKLAPRVGTDAELAEALRDGDDAAARRRAGELRKELGLVRLRIADREGTRVDVGSKNAVAAATRTLEDAEGSEFGRLQLSDRSAPVYAREVKRLAGLEVVVRGTGGVSAATLRNPPRGVLPRVGELTVNDIDYRVASFPARGFDDEVVRVSILSSREEIGSEIGRSRWLAGGVLAGFFILAITCAVLVSRSLQAQIGDFLEAARRLARGDFSAQVPTHGRDEFASLGEEFNRMASQLEQRLEDLRRERVRLESTLRRLGEAFASNLDRDALLAIGVRTTADGVGADGGRATGRDGERARSGDLGELEPFVVQAETEALGSGQPREVPTGTGSALAHPLRAAEGDEVLGLVSVWRRDKPFAPSERELFHYLAGQVGVSLENVRLHETVQRQAVTDELTGLSNHRRFQDTLASEVERARRFDAHLGLVMLDIDNFKLVNDTYGHQVGDQVLAAVARVLREQSREIDEPARYGGEELAVVLPGTDLEGAFNLAERVRAGIEALSFETANGTLTVSASFGAASIPESATDHSGLIAAADSALYVAKRAGKNRTERAVRERALTSVLSAAMGLLDDAIREHLELKRQHGADPAEVAAQEREVLSEDLPGVTAEAPADIAAPPAAHDDDPFADLGPPPPLPPEPDPDPAPVSEHHGAVTSARFAAEPEDDIDWSEPAPVADPEPEPAPAAEAEDVLEETPEFLEETPEHDRLWFEQRPPKDFDF